MVLGLGFLLTAAHADPTTSAEYHIGPQDVLHLDVYTKADLGGDYVVTFAGKLMIPFCDGGVSVAGSTLLEAENAVRECLAAGVLVDPQISLKMGEHRSQRVELVGAVKQPGEYFLDGPSTLRGVIARAGGVELDRTTGMVVLVRDGERITMALDEVGGERGAIELRAGDVVMIEQSEVVLVGGQVAKPGPVAFTEGMTVTEALLRAGDATAVANLAGSYILRDGGKISVNLRRMRRGRKADFVLEPGDTLVVPESPI